LKNDESSAIEDTFKRGRNFADGQPGTPPFRGANRRGSNAVLSESKNRILTCGMGKSGLIARKVAATLTSTGSPAVFLHPADALHGDIGNLQAKEVVLAFLELGRNT
jgi:D-arabinose 5-phosphate isomerase GutQ